MPMKTKLTVRRIGNFLGVILGKEALTEPRVAEGDALFVVRAPRGHSTDTRVGLLHLSGLQPDLQDLLGVPDDLLPRGGLKPVIRGAVLEEVRELYAA